ncbi:probable glutamate receptor [Portunus trituberculatus]|uniref:probable glutamate receptor n=1 Tax=Portunus trituberculatus TaxID=210409 RepID=UPI001E1D0A5F|nr:probable glutamate receptor [Portunus trituberculatus]
MHLIIETLLCLLLSAELVWMNTNIYPSGNKDWFHRTAGALEAVLSQTSNNDMTLVALTDGRIPHRSIERMLQALVSRGVCVFQAEMDGEITNATHARLSHTIEKARQIRVRSLSVTMAVVSQNPAFLAAFAELSLTGRLQMWSTRVIIHTSLPLRVLTGMHKLLSTRNCMLLLANELYVYTKKLTTHFLCTVLDQKFLIHRKKKSHVNIYAQLPYTAEDSLPLTVAAWNPLKGLTLVSYLSLFPEKYHRLVNNGTLLSSYYLVTEMDRDSIEWSLPLCEALLSFRFPTAPHLTVTVELLPHHTFSWTEDVAAPGGRRLVFTGTMDKTVRYFSKAMNFTYTYARSPEKTFGTRLPDGYWTGMMGMVVREEADFGTGPFILNKARYDAADVTSTIWMDNMRIVSGMGSPEVDPWGFLFPLRPMVWMALITTFFGIMAVTELLSLFNLNVHATTNAFSVVRILLQQDEYTCNKRWVWERLVLGLWMLTTLVLTKSYAGNLMSLLAVKYVPQPFQTLRDVLDNNEIISIWQRYSSNEQFIREVQSGIYYEVAMLEKEDRLKFRTQGEFPESLRTLVRPGHHILVDAGVTVRNLIAQQFSLTGRCDYFRSKQGFLPFSAVVATQRNNPLVISLDKRVHELMESGIFRYWFRTAIPNSSTCDNPPRRFLETTPLAATNLWGMFVVLAGGLAMGIISLCVELFAGALPQH